jgi:hypothetical protein
MSDLNSPTITVDPITFAKNTRECNEAYTLLTQAAAKLDDDGDGELEVFPQRLRTMAALVKTVGSMDGVAKFITESARLGLPYEETLAVSAKRLDELWGDEQVPELAAGLRELDGKLSALAAGRS